MVPHGLHGLVGLRAVNVIGAVIHILVILVISQYDMRLVAMTFIAHSRHVVRLVGHSKVVRTNNTLVIIRQCHTAQLCKKTVLGSYLCPTLIKIE